MFILIEATGQAALAPTTTPPWLPQGPGASDVGIFWRVQVLFGLWDALAGYFDSHGIDFSIIWESFG